MNEKRIVWIDTAKGLGIIMVILGHLYIDNLSVAIYSFHIPLFFFLAGYTYNTNQPFTVFLRKKTNSLLIPYAVASLMICAFMFFRDIAIGGADPVRVLLFHIKTLIIQRRKWTLWFISVLFSLCMIYYPLHRARCHIVLPATLVLFAGGILYNKYGGGFLPFNFDATLMVCPYFAAGIVSKQYSFVDKYILNFSQKQSSERLFVMNLIIAIGSTYLSYRLTGQRLDVFYAEYGVIPLTLVSALAGIACVIYICQFIHCKWLISIGRNSFVYFAFHQQIFITIINDYIEKYHLFSTVFVPKFSRIIFSFVLTVAILGITSMFIKIIERTRYSHLLTGHKMEIT